jgi:hypothetical protein
VGRVHYNFVSSSREGLEDNFGICCFVACYVRRAEEIVMDLRYCMDSCRITVWVLSWIRDGGVANHMYLIS